MLPNTGGPGVDALASRRAHDEDAYIAARPAAEREILKLLSTLRSPRAASLEVERQARAALSAVGLLWETAARLNE